MVNRKAVVVTTYGRGNTIDKIAFSLFDNTEDSQYREEASDAKTYCDMINFVELEDDSWVSARKVSENKQYVLKDFLQGGFSEMILKLDDIVIQKMLMKIDHEDLDKALKNQDEAVKEKIFKNMSKRGYQIFKEDMRLWWRLDIAEVKRSQEKILKIIQSLEKAGEIVISSN